MARFFLAFAIFIAGLCRGLPSAVSPLASRANQTVDLVYQFPPTMAPENQFLRSNGQLLVTCLTCNVLSQIDPTLGPTQQRRTVYTFPDGILNVLGIDELFRDVFVVAVGRVNLTDPSAINGTNLTSLVQGPTGVYVVDLRNYQAPTYDSTRVRAFKVGGTNTGGLFDGLAIINASKGLVATADIFEGNIWLIDILHGISTILVEQPVLPASNGEPSSFLLTNGLKYRDSKLYFSASLTGTYGYVPVNYSTGKATGPVQVLYNYGGITIDDFNFGPTGNAYLTTFSTPNGGILKRAAGTPAGQSGTTMPVSYFGTNSVITRNGKGGTCDLIITAVLQFQVVRTNIPGPC